MMNERIKRQIRNIVEEKSGERRSVIVRMANPQEEARPRLEAASKVVRNRSVLLTARDSLPADRGAPGQTASRATPKPFISSDPQALKGSLSVGAPSMGPREPPHLKAQALERLQPLVQNDRIQRTLETRQEGTPEQAAGDLWASTSLALDVTVDDLSSLPDEVAGIQEVYPNRILRLPPLAEVHNVPEAVRENRASSWGVHKIGALAAWG